MILFKKTKIWEEGGGKQLYHQKDQRGWKDKEYDQHCPPPHPRKSILMCGKYKSSKMSPKKL